MLDRKNDRKRKEKDGQTDRKKERQTERKKRKKEKRKERKTERKKRKERKKLEATKDSLAVLYPHGSGVCKRPSKEGERGMKEGGG